MSGDYTELANDIATYLHTTYYPYDPDRLGHFKRGLSLLMSSSQLWTSNRAATPDTCNQIMDHIKRAHFDDQLGLCCLIIHCIGDDEWHQRSKEHDTEYYMQEEFPIHPVVWMFKMRPKDLMRTGAREEYSYKSEGFMLGLLRTEQKMWEMAGDNRNNSDQKNGLEKFVVDLEEWCPW